MNCDAVGETGASTRTKCKERTHVNVKHDVTLTFANDINSKWCDAYNGNRKQEGSAHALVGLHISRKICLNTCFICDAINHQTTQAMRPRLDFQRKFN